MKHWLVTFNADMPAEKRSQAIEEAGAELAEGTDPVPLGDEVSVEVTAKEEAVEALKANPCVKGVFPSSDMTLY